MGDYKTIKVLFAETIKETDKMFCDAEKWGVSTLKEWIDSYETTRFTQIDECSAIITSEYNMDFVKEWLKRNIHNIQIQDIN